MANNPTQTSTEDKARQVKSAAVQAVGEVKEEAKAIASNAAEALSHAREETSVRLHDARDAAVDRYHALREQAVDTARDVQHGARVAVERSARFARAAGSSTRDFVGLHALPLAVVGAGLGWLAWSVQREARRRVETPRYTRHELEADFAPEVRYRDDYALQQRPYAYSAAPTTTGEKLLGVRTR